MTQAEIGERGNLQPAVVSQLLVATGTRHSAPRPRWRMRRAVGWSYGKNRRASSEYESAWLSGAGYWATLEPRDC